MNELDEAVLRKAGQMVATAEAERDKATARRDDLIHLTERMTETLRLIAIRTSDPWAMGMADSCLQSVRSPK